VNCNNICNRYRRRQHPTSPSLLSDAKEVVTEALQKIPSSTRFQAETNRPSGWNSNMITGRMEMIMSFAPRRASSSAPCTSILITSTRSTRPAATHCQEIPCQFAVHTRLDRKCYPWPVRRNDSGMMIEPRSSCLVREGHGKGLHILKLFMAILRRSTGNAGRMVQRKSPGPPAHCLARHRCVDPEVGSPHQRRLFLAKVNFSK